METINKIANLLLSEDQANRYIGANIVLSQNIDLDKVLNDYRNNVFREIKDIYESGVKALFSRKGINEYFNFDLFDFSLNGWCVTTDIHKRLGFSVTLFDRGVNIDGCSCAYPLILDEDSLLNCIDVFISLVKPLFKLPNLENI